MTGLLSGVAMAAVVTGLGLGSLLLIGGGIVIAMMVYYLNKIQKKEMDITDIPFLKIWGIALLVMSIILFSVQMYNHYHM